MSKDKKDPIIVKEGPQPCGCYVTEFSDDTKLVQFCLVCGMMEAAQALNVAAQAFGSIATHLRDMQKNNAMARAVASVPTRGKGPKIIEP